MPFTHVEAFVLGFLVGRGSIRMGPWLPILFVLLVITAFINKACVGDSGFGFPLRVNYSYLWGYPLVAFFAASLCDTNGNFARRCQTIMQQIKVDKIICKLSYFSYGAYVFHGAIIAIIALQLPFLKSARSGIFLPLAWISTLSFAAAWLIGVFQERVFRVLKPLISVRLQKWMYLATPESV